MTSGAIRIAIGLLVAAAGIAAIFQDVPHPALLSGAAAAIAGVALFSWGVASRHRHSRCNYNPRSNCTNARFLVASHKLRFSRITIAQDFSLHESRVSVPKEVSVSAEPILKGHSLGYELPAETLWAVSELPTAQRPVSRG